MALSLLSLLIFGGCPAGDADRRALRVYAAASLQEAFQALKRRFETLNPGVTVALSFGGSHLLRHQIAQGAPADVFASASVGHINALVEGAFLVSPVRFARNRLVVIVPKENPAGIQTFSDLPRARRLVVGVPSVPVGAYTQEMLRRAKEGLGETFATRVRASVASEEANVRLVRAKVSLDEADAAIVYVTDAAPDATLRRIPIPAQFNVRADYWVGRVGGGQASRLASRWIAFMRSAEGRAILTDHHFEVE